MDLLIWVAALLGMAAHWAKRWGRKQCCASFVQYFLVHERRASLAALGTMAAAVMTFVTTWDGDLTRQALATAFLAGYAADSAVNKE